MEVILKQGDVLNIPEGCNATIDGNTVIIEEKKQDFKDGDVLIDDLVKQGDRYKIMMIYKGEKGDDGSYKYYVCRFTSGQLDQDSTCCSANECKIRLATEEEKQQFFDKMKENGLRWNAEEKKVEKIRWRAKNKGKYYIINPSLYPSEDVELTSSMDDNRWDAFNYFQSRKQAEQAAELVKETLKKFHEENNYTI